MDAMWRSHIDILYWEIPDNHKNNCSKLVSWHMLATGLCCLFLQDTLGTASGEILYWADLIQESSPTSSWEHDGIWGNLLWALVCPIIFSEILLALFNHSHRENMVTKWVSRKSICANMSYLQCSDILLQSKTNQSIWRWQHITLLKINLMAAWKASRIFYSLKILT